VSLIPIIVTTPFCSLWKSHNHPIMKNISFLLWSSAAHHRVHRIPPLNHIRRQLNPVFTQPSQYDLHPRMCLSNDLSLQVFRLNYFMNLSSPHACYMSRQYLFTHFSYAVLLQCQDFHFSLNLYTIGRTTRTSDRPVARPLPKYRQHKHRMNARARARTHTHTHTHTHQTSML
jgi:hypothetical protein